MKLIKVISTIERIIELVVTLLSKGIDKAQEELKELSQKIEDIQKQIGLLENNLDKAKNLLIKLNNIFN